jgi:predicted deacylase
LCADGGAWRKPQASRFDSFASAAEIELFYIRTPSLKANGGIYISAGIHGDEAGATEGLITWAEKNSRNLARLPLLIFPCLNPWGLMHNMRTNETGVDLNRAFQRDDVPVVRALRELLKAHQFEVALILHEDYDAQGIYLYEVCSGPPYWGADLLQCCHSASSDRSASSH